MSRITLDVSCPKCESENIISVFGEDSEKILCRCSNCGNIEYLEDMLYLIEE